MIHSDSLFVLLMNLEAFIKSVPIDPKSPDYKQWKECRPEMKRALKKAYKILELVEDREILQKKMPVRALTFPCKIIPVKQPMHWPEKFCGRPLIRQVREEYNALKKKR
jgi:hypothetical protein